MKEYQIDFNKRDTKLELREQLSNYGFDCQDNQLQRIQQNSYQMDQNDMCMNSESRSNRSKRGNMSCELSDSSIMYGKSASSNKKSGSRNKKSSSKR